MAIIVCKECNKTMSSMAGRCPHCGAIPLLKNKNVLYLFFVIALGIYVWIDTNPVKTYPSLGNYSNKTEADSAVNSPTYVELPQPSNSPINISAINLYRAYQSNEVKADIDYKGQRLAVNGVIGKIEKDIFDYPLVMLNIDGFNHVRAKFPKSQAAEIANLKQFDNVTLTCIGDGVVLSSPKLDCTK